MLLSYLNVIYQGQKFDANVPIIYHNCPSCQVNRKKRNALGRAQVDKWVANEIARRSVVLAEWKRTCLPPQDDKVCFLLSSCNSCKKILVLHPCHAVLSIIFQLLAEFYRMWYDLYIWISHELQYKFNDQHGSCRQVSQEVVGVNVYG